MSQVLTVKQICERALRAINAFPITDSAADGEQLREAMIWLDLILGQEAGSNKIFSLIPTLSALQIPILNGKGSYDLAGSLGANAPTDGIQDAISARLIIPSGQSVIAFASSIPGGVALGQTAVDQTNPAAIPPSATVVSINNAANQVTITSPSVVATGDNIVFGTNSPIVATGTVGGNGLIAGTATHHRHPIEIVKRETFEATRLPDENGHPRMIYIDRLPDSQLSVHPYPQATDTNLYILDIDVQTYAPNVSPLGVTGTQSVASNLIKFRQAWNRYFVFQLAHDLGSGPIFKIAETSLNRFGKVAVAARAELLAFENQEHDDEPPICDSFERHDHLHRHHHRAYDYGWGD